MDNVETRYLCTLLAFKPNAFDRLWDRCRLWEQQS